MRDLIILVLLVGGCVWSLRYPWVGAILWAVISLGSPHQQFGYAAAGWPVGMAMAGCTLLGLLVTKERRNPFDNAAVMLTLALSIWMTIAQPFAFEPDLSFDLWERSIKIFAMLFVTLALIDTREKLNVFIWANVVAIGFYGIKGGLFSIMTGGQFIIIGPGGFIGGNNELALAEIMVLPFIRYLQQQAVSKWLRRGLGISMGLLAISIVVSHSRGALLGLVAMLFFFWLKNDKKFRFGLIIVIGMAVILAAMPDEWWSRMDTIKSYEEDASAQGRINSWWLAWNVATDRITGGGFRLTVPWIFAKYAPNPRMIFVAHSIYFQLMGEQGFIGLVVFLLIGVTTWVNAKRMIRAGLATPELKWAADLGGMVHASMIGFAVSGAFLSMAYFDLPYNVMAMTAVALYLINHSVAMTGVTAKQAVGGLPLPSPRPQPRPPPRARPPASPSRK